MHHLAGNRNRATDIVPAADLANREHIARLEDHVSVGFAGESALDIDFAMLQVHVIAIDYGVAGKIRGLAVGAALETARNTKQISRGHLFSKRILSRTQHLAKNRDLGRIRLITAE